MQHRAAKASAPERLRKRLEEETLKEAQRVRTEKKHARAWDPSIQAGNMIMRPVRVLPCVPLHALSLTPSTPLSCVSAVYTVYRARTIESQPAAPAWHTVRWHTAQGPMVRGGCAWWRGAACVRVCDQDSHQTRIVSRLAVPEGQEFGYTPVPARRRRHTVSHLRGRRSHNSSRSQGIGQSVGVGAEAHDQEPVDRSPRTRFADNTVPGGDLVGSGGGAFAFARGSNRKGRRGTASTIRSHRSSAVPAAAPERPVRSRVQACLHARARARARACVCVCVCVCVCGVAMCVWRLTALAPCGVSANSGLRGRQQTA